MKTRKQFVDWRGAVVPQRTSTYEPVPHEELFDLADKWLSSSGYQISTRKVDQNIDGQVATAHFNLVRSDATDFSQQFAVMNSYNKTKPVSFFSGAHVFVCSNGLVISDIVTVRKHTPNIWNDAKGKAMEAISVLDNNWNKLKSDERTMKDVKLSITLASELLGRLFIEERMITTPELNIVRGELKSPTFNYDSPDSIWELYQHITHAKKEAPINRSSRELKGVHDFMVQYAEDFAIVNG